MIRKDAKGDPAAEAFYAKLKDTELDAGNALEGITLVETP